LVGMGRRLQDVEEMFMALVEQIRRGIEINGKKTKFVIESQKPYNENEYVHTTWCTKF